MLPIIHSIADQIIFRKSLKWKDIEFQKHTPIDCLHLYTQLEKSMYIFLNQLITNEKKAELIQQCISNLCSIKGRLDEVPWIVSHKLSDEVKAIYLNDLDFYLMLSGILLKSHSVFNGFIPNDQLPAQTKMIPLFSSHPKRVKQVLSQIPNSKWTQTIACYQKNNKYLRELIELKKHTYKNNNNPKLKLLFNKMLSFFQTYPDTQYEENHKEKIIKRLNMRLQTFNTFPKELDILHHKLTRAAFSAILIYGDITTGKLIPTYFSLMNKLLHSNPYYTKDDVHFFKKLEKQHCSLNKEKLPINPLLNVHLYEVLNHLHKIRKNFQPLSVAHPFITWTHNPKIFVKMVHSAINEGYISFRGNSDIKPIIEFLCQFIHVRKQNNSGILSASSLLTYFKKANSGDL